MPSALWCVLNGRAMAPPGIGCIIGVSTSRKPRASRNFRIAATSRARSTKIVRTSSRSEEHTSELQSRSDLVCRLLLEKKKHLIDTPHPPSNAYVPLVLFRYLQ